MGAVKSKPKLHKSILPRNSQPEPQTSSPQIERPRIEKQPVLTETQRQIAEIDAMLAPSPSPVTASLADSPLRTPRVKATDTDELNAQWAEYREKCDRISAWLRDLIEEDVPADLMQESLADGKILCFIADELTSYSCMMKHIWPRNTKEEIENIELFLKSCVDDWKIPEPLLPQLFTIDDVRTPVGDDPSRMLKVVDCLDHISTGFVALSPKTIAKLERKKVGKRQFDLGKYLFLRGGDKVGRVEIVMFKKMLLLLEMFHDKPQSLPMGRFSL